MVGAMRASLARSNGWDGRSPWGNKQINVLGDGFDDLGRLDFFGPYLLRETDPPNDELECEALFAAPLSLMGQKLRDEAGGADNKPKWRPKTLLRPDTDDQATLCDLGDAVHLPTPDMDVDGLKDAGGIWLTVDGLTSVLAGEVPDADQCFRSKDLWKHEARIGLKRDADSRATGDGALYSPSYVRPQRGVSVGVRVEGVPADWTVPDRTPFGGENRLANIDAAGQITMPAPPNRAIRDSGHISLNFVTPARFERDTMAEQFKPGRPLPPAFGAWAGCTLVSACIGKPVFIGGWNSLKHRPMDLEPYLPAGSTLFLDVDDDQIDDVIGMHGKKIGQRTAYGFGQAVVGTW